MQINSASGSRPYYEKTATMSVHWVELFLFPILSGNPSCRLYFAVRYSIKTLRPPLNILSFLSAVKLWNRMKYPPVLQFTFKRLARTRIILDKLPRLAANNIYNTADPLKQASAGLLILSSPKNRMVANAWILPGWCRLCLRLIGAGLGGLQPNIELFCHSGLNLIWCISLCGHVAQAWARHRRPPSNDKMALG